ncbi:unnamed protein product, partial [Phaeothamnion confervicola]
MRAAKAGDRAACEHALTTTGKDPRAFVTECFESNGGNALHYAASAGSAAVLEYLLDLGCDVDTHKRDAKTPLHEACNHGQGTAVELLLARGANVNAKKTNDWSPLHYAAQHGTVGPILALLKAGADVDGRNREGASPLLLAAREGHKEAVAALLEAGAAPDATTRTLRTPLLTAVAHGRAGVVSQLLAAGASPAHADSCGQTVWHACAAAGDEAMARHLLAAGVRPAASEDAGGGGSGTNGSRDGASGGSGDATAAGSSSLRGQHPLHQAALEGHAGFVAFLFREGLAVPDTADADGATALYYASSGGHTECMEVLLAVGADPSRASVRRAPLHACAGWRATAGSMVAARYAACVRQLLEAGADVWARDKDGRTALEVA